MTTKKCNQQDATSGQCVRTAPPRARRLSRAGHAKRAYFIKLGAQSGKARRRAA